MRRWLNDSLIKIDNSEDGGSVRTTHRCTIECKGWGGACVRRPIPPAAKLELRADVRS